jgi:hypothetical protein
LKIAALAADLATRKRSLAAALLPKKCPSGLLIPAGERKKYTAIL